MSSEPVDLDRLDSLFAAATKGEWTVEIEEYGNSGTVTIPEINRILHDTDWADPQDFQRDQDNAEWMAESHNAYPALAAELRTLRARVAELEHIAEIDKGIYEATREDRENAYRLLAGTVAAIGSEIDTKLASEPEIIGAVGWALIERDARMRREGAAEVWDQVANYEGNKEFPAIVRRFDALNNAARLREGGE